MVDSHKKKFHSPTLFPLTCSHVVDLPWRRQHLLVCPACAFLAKRDVATLDMPHSFKFNPTRKTPRWKREQRSTTREVRISSSQLWIPMDGINDAETETIGQSEAISAEGHHHGGRSSTSINRKFFKIQSRGKRQKAFSTCRN